MAMPAVGRFSGTPASIKASDEPQTVAMEDEPFDFGDLRDDPDRVGKFRRRRQHRTDGAPGKLAMADFAPSGRAHAAGLADRIGREIIMEQEALLVGALETDRHIARPRPVPSVATTSACVSPRVNSAEPCVRGRTPTSRTIGRTVFTSRPSMRMPVSRMFQRTTLACRSWKTSATCSLENCGSPSAGKSAAKTFAFTASTAL